MNQVEIKKRQMELCSYMLGLITLLVLGGVLGDNGIAYIAAAAEGFGFFWTLTGGRLANVLGRMIWNRSSRGQYKNVSKIKRTIIVVEGFVGLLGSALMAVSAPFLADHIFFVPYSVSLLVLLAPVIFLRTLSSTILGYFQGDGTQLPSVISYFLRQVLVLVFSLVFTKVFCSYGTKVSVLLRQKDFVAMYGGMGVVLAILLTEILILALLILIYRGTRSGRKKGDEGMRTTETFGNHVRVLYIGLFPQILTSLLQMLPLWLGLIFYRKSYGDTTALNEYGIFYGKYMVICWLVILPICAFLAGCAAKTASCLRREELRYARNYFMGGLHMAVVNAVFFSVLAAVLAPYLAELFCAGGADVCENMLRFGSFIIAFAVVKFYFSDLLAVAGNKYLHWACLLLYNIVFVISLVFMIKSMDMGILALVNAGLFATILYVLAAGFLISYQTGIRFEWLQSIAIPVCTSFVIGLVEIFLSKAMYPHLGCLVTVFVCVLIAVLLYWTALLLLHNFREQEMNYLPGGKWIQAIERMLRIF